jgi:hypothetical protein
MVCFDVFVDYSAFSRDALGVRFSALILCCIDGFLPTQTGP